MRRWLLPIILALAPALAQHGAAPAGPARLFEGLGGHHHPISTARPEAQKFFDQGLTLVFGFNHEEAIRSFRRAAELDPKAAMPWWGIALALGPNINLDVDPEREKAAYEAAQKARELARGGPQHERDYIDALTKRYSIAPNADLKKMAVDYANAMRELTRKYPDDLDLATLFAESMMDLRPWQLWSADGKPAEGTPEIIEVLESVLRRNPLHVGANHYYIHAVEASTTPERALPSAERLKTLVPAAGHLVHMPGHIYLRTGDFESAARTNEVAAEVDRRYLRATGVQGVYPLMYYPHNLHFLAYSRVEQGRYAEARKAAAQLKAQVVPGLKEMPMVEFFAVVPYLVELRSYKYDEVLRIPEADGPLRKAYRNFVRSAAFAAKGDLASASAERDRFEAARKQVPKDLTWDVAPIDGILAVASAELNARLARDPARAIDLWREAVRAQDQAGYTEPPPWFRPVREALGGALLRAGRHAEAEAVFREGLAQNPRAPRLLFGLLETLKAQKKTASAAWVEREFNEVWKSTEVKLSIDQL